jgi:hypothetical protein
MSGGRAVAVTGLGVWRPGARALDDGLLPPAHRRRATALARMGADVLAQALGGRSPDDVALILVSAGGELDNTFANLALLDGDPPASSPLRFGNAVHNAALGHLSIPFGNRAFGSALAVSGGAALAMGLLEAVGWVVAHRAPAVVWWAEEAWPAGAAPGAWEPAAAAVALAPCDAPERRGWLSAPRRGAVGGAWPAADGNPVGGACAWVDRLRGPAGVLDLGGASVAGGPGWVCDWEPG